MSPRPRTSRKQLGERARVGRSVSARLVLVLAVFGASCWSQTAEAGGPHHQEASAPGSSFALPFAPELSPLLSSPPAGGPGATIPVKPTPAPPEPSEDEDEDEDAELLEQPTQTLPTMQLEPPKLQRKLSVPPFWIGREYDTHTTTALTFPPLYVHRQPKPGHESKLFHFDLSLTVAYYHKGRNKQRWMNPLVLFFYGKSEHKTVWASLPLLMGYRKVGDQFNFGQFPLVWWWGNRHVKNLFVFPFHYRKHAPDQVFGVSGLLAWYGNRNLDDENPDNDRRHFVFAPVYWRFQTGLRTIDISPIYFGGKDLATGLTHRTLLPFFHWQSREFGNRKELWTLPWVRRTDIARGRDAWALPLLLTFRDRNPRRELMSITPLVWSHRDRLRDRTTWVALLGGAIQDPNQDISWVAPIWWRFHDRRSDSAVNIVAPLALWRSSPERFAFHSLIASGWRNRGEAKGGGGGSLPLLTFVGHSPLRSRQFVLGGVFWRFANKDPNGTGALDPEAQRSAWGVGPLVYRSTRGQDRARFGIPPLLTFVGREGQKSHQVVTPLFWHVRNRDPEHQHDTWVLAPLYFQKRATGFRTGLPPLFVAANDERYRYAVAPLLLFGHVEDKQAGTSRTIWPLFVHAKTPHARVIGAGLLAWDVKRQMTVDGEAQPWRDSVLFPLYYRRARGDARLHLSPLGGALRNEHGHTWLATLAYGFSREAGPGQEQFARRGGGFLPLIHHETRRDAEGKLVGATSVVFPLFGRDRRPERDLDVWTPLIWRASVRGDKPRNNLAIVPLYFGQRQPGGIDVDAGLLWFWSRDRTRHTHTVVAGPFYHRLTREKLITGLGPLSYWEDSSKRRLLVVPPLIVSIEDKLKRQRTTVALPLWFDRTQQNDARRVWMAFPFVFGSHRKHDFTKAGLAFPLFYDIHRLRKNFRFTGVVPLLFRYQKGGFRADDEADARYTLWGSFPLFFYGHDAKGRRTHSALGLYWWDKNPEGFKFYTLLGGVGQQPGKSLTWYAPLVYRKVTNEQHTTFVWPVFAYHKGYRKDESGKPYKDISTTWVLPPLYVARRNEDRSWWQSTLLVWQFRRPHKVSTAVLPPLFFIQDSFKQRRLHWLLPLYVRDNHMAKGEAWTAVLPGLYVAHRNLQHDHAVQFPFVWHFANHKRRVTVGVPLWYDVRLHERGTATQVVPGLYARRQTEAKVAHMIGPGLASWRREAEGQSPALHWRALFWLIGGGNEDGQRYMWLFGGKIKLKPKPLAPRKRRTKTKPKPAVEDQAARNEAIEADYLRF